MTPIKVGEYTVLEVTDATRCWGRYEVRDSHGQSVWGDLGNGRPSGLVHSRRFHTLPMALRVAAEAAGIERQRVEVELLTDSAAPYLVSRLDLDWIAQPVIWERSERGWSFRIERIDAFDCSVISRAEKFATDRYAALGGAA